MNNLRLRPSREKKAIIFALCGISSAVRTVSCDLALSAQKPL